MVGILDVETGKISASYCHWASELDDELPNYWDSEHGAEQLAYHGYMSEIDRGEIEVTPGAIPGEDTEEYSEYKNITELMEKMAICDYFYIWENNDWTVYGGYHSYQLGRDVWDDDEDDEYKD